MDKWLGLVGAITGVLSFAMSIAAFRRTGMLKAADLTVEILKRRNRLAIEAPALLPHLDLADRSRKAVASAKGIRQSGAMTLWNQAFQADRASAVLLTQQAEKAAEPSKKDSVATLTQLLATTDLLLEKIISLRSKYAATIAADDIDRDRIADFQNQVAVSVATKR